MSNIQHKIFFKINFHQYHISKTSSSWEPFGTLDNGTENPAFCHQQISDSSFRFRDISMQDRTCWTEEEEEHLRILVVGDRSSTLGHLTSSFVPFWRSGIKHLVHPSTP